MPYEVIPFVLCGDPNKSVPKQTLFFILRHLKHFFSGKLFAIVLREASIFAIGI